MREGLFKRALNDAEVSVLQWAVKKAIYGSDYTKSNDVRFKCDVLFLTELVRFSMHIEKKERLINDTVKRYGVSEEAVVYYLYHLERYAPEYLGREISCLKHLENMTTL